jgi:hypothetical protein
VRTQTVIAIVAVILALGAGCAKKTASEGTRTPDAVKAEVAALAGELDAYLGQHDFENTEAAALTAQTRAISSKFAALQADAARLADATGNKQFEDAAAAAEEGRAASDALAAAFAAGPPQGDAGKADKLNAAVTAWAAYTDAVAKYQPATALAAAAKTTASPPAVKAGTAATTLPGKGRHLGWWKNPAWARDVAARATAATAAPPGKGDRERERDRERKHTGPGGEPDRERGRGGDSDAGGHGKGRGGD